MPERKPSPKKRRKARPKALQPIKFVAVERAFKPQIKVRANLDVNGWVSRERGIKFAIGKGRVGFVDADIARVWAAKGFVQILEGDIEPVSADELAELTSKDTTIELGETNG